MDDCVQYIVVRKDLVPAMGIGKTAAQAAHASLAPLLDHLPDGSVKLIGSEAVKEWLRGRFTKVVVYVRNKGQLLKLEKQLSELLIKSYIIRDTCRTKLVPEESDGTTITCLGVEPLDREKVPKCLQKLQLLE